MSGSIFISYSHKDEDWKERVISHLRPAFESLAVWDDRRIEAGENWHAEIKNAIEAAQIAVLLVSANALGSRFIMEEEAPLMLERHNSHKLRLIPLVIKPCHVNSPKFNWLRELQMRPRDGEPLSSMTESKAEDAIARLVEEIEKMLTPPFTKPEISPLASCEPLPIYLTCNRTIQEGAFRRTFRVWHEHQRCVPQIHILLGKREDRHRSFVERLRRFYLKEDLGLTALPMFVEWPAGGAPGDDEATDAEIDWLRDLLLEKLFSEFIKKDGAFATYYRSEFRRDPQPAASLARLSETLKSQVILIEHLIPCWNSVTHRLFQCYRDFWREVQKHNCEKQFLIFLNVFLPDGQAQPFPGLLQEDNSKLTPTELGAAAGQQLPGSLCLVAKKFSNVNQDDVIIWAGANDLELDDDTVENFFGGQPELPMMKVEKWLKSLCANFEGRKTNYE